ncbi:MAG: carotenoid 1,2-hydratase [Hyphomicrobium sp.]
MLNALGKNLTVDAGPDFSQGVAQNGYAWWYVDALSDDGRHGLTIIAMIGSVFSPYYARARRRGLGDPENHCGLNVALYGRAGKRWALTERGRGAIFRSERELAIGPSRVHWDGTDLVIEIDEVTVPIPSRLQGAVRLSPAAMTRETFTLAENGRHRWRPIAPYSRVTVDMKRPGLTWSGNGYFDWNSGERALEVDFSGWHWSRATSSSGATIFYDGDRRREGPFSLALDIAPDGTVRRLEPPPLSRLPTTPIWRIARTTRSDAAAAARLVETCEDTPFYARSIADLTIGGRPTRAMHESLSLDRFDTAWVQCLLPFRMPRAASWTNR